MRTLEGRMSVEFKKKKKGGKVGTRWVPGLVLVLVLVPDV